MPPIPFNRPRITGNELKYIAAAVASGHASGDGEFTKQCHALLGSELASARVLLTTSCTHALEMMALLLDISPGDEVIVPSFTFVSTANAFVLRGATPVFADVRPDTLNLDERQVPELLTDRTKAVVAVHYAGVACAMDDLNRIAAPRGVAVVEDNAHGLFGRYRGRPLGTLGTLASLSFHETKNVTCGEGGALIINDEGLFGRAEIIREKGTNRSQFFRGDIDKYTWIDLGSSYLPSEILAAFLLAQLEERDHIQARRRQLWNAYHAGLARWAEDTGTVLPFVPEDCDQAYHLFYLILPTASARHDLMAHLSAAGIMALSHYVPLDTSPMGRRVGRRGRACPVTADISARLLRLPFYTDLSNGEQERVVASISQWRPA